MITILNQDSSYTLLTERLRGKWWLELIDRATGMTQALVCDTKAKAFEFFDGLDLSKVKSYMDRFGVESVPMYKKGRM